ncbi:MAG: hypothetical protein WCJ40_18565 [Planctomycetota bacterium]
MATELYVGGWDNPSQQAVFGKIDSETGAYTQISSGLGLDQDRFTGLAWDPGISAFHTLSNRGWLSTITKTGTTSSPTGLGPTRANVRLAYNANTGKLHRLATKDPNLKNDGDVNLSITINGAEVSKNSHTEALERLAAEYQALARKTVGLVDYSFYGTAFVKGKLCCTVSKMFDARKYDPRSGFQNSGKNNDFYGLFDLETARFQEIFSDRAFHAMQLAYDGSTLFGLNDYRLYTLNPEKGDFNLLAKVTGISEGNTIFQCMSAIPVIAS